MGKSDYYRPADYQITTIYRCHSCGKEVEQQSCYGVGRCDCGGSFAQVGESYPADIQDWDEERGRDGEWHRRY